MKRLLVIALLLIVAVIVTPFLFQDDGVMAPVQGLPWQIETHSDGTSSVFGLTLARSTLADAQARFGPDLEIAVMAAPGEAGALEAYLAHFTAGVLTGKLILSASTAPERMQGMRERAVRARPTATGALKLELAAPDRTQALQAVISVITFVPNVDIDADTATKRFGEPAQRIADEHGATHYLYPDKGLDLILNPKQKEVLQYVAPEQFERLLQPLRKAATGTR